MRETMDRGADMHFPVDNATYNLMTTLTEKLQALETYRKYSKDVSGPEGDLYQQLIDEDTRHAEQLVELLRERFARR